MLRRDDRAAAGSDANAVAALTSATSATAALRAAAPRADPPLEFGGEGGDVGTKSCDLAQQIRRLDRVCAFAAQDGARQSTHAPLGCSEPVGQTRMKVWGGEPVVDQREGGNSHHDRSAPVYAGVEYARRRVDLRHRDQGDGVAGQDGAVRPVAIQKTTDVDAKPEPSRECQHEQLARLCEQPGDRKRRDHPDDGAEDPVDGLLVGLSPRLQGENADGNRSGRGALELQPERRVQRHHHGGPDP